MLSLSSPATGPPAAVCFYVPAAFDATHYPELVDCEDEAHWLLNRITSLANTYRHGQTAAKDTDFFPISVQTMRTYMQPRVCKLVREVLIQNGVIECDGVYRPEQFNGPGSAKSLGYRLAPAYRGVLRRVDCTNLKLSARILRNRIIVNGKPHREWELDPLHEHLYSCLKQLRIDRERAYAIIDQISATDPYRQWMNRMTVDLLALTTESPQPLEFHKDDYGRLHTSVTRLLSEARECLTLEGEPVVGIDIRNSQLIFLLLLILESIHTELTGTPQEYQRSKPNGRKDDGGDGGRDGGSLPLRPCSTPVRPSAGPSSNRQVTVGYSSYPYSISPDKSLPCSLEGTGDGDGDGGRDDGRGDDGGGDDYFGWIGLCSPGCPWSLDDSSPVGSPPLSKLTLPHTPSCVNHMVVINALLPPDVQRFTTLVLDGLLYDHLMKVIGATDRKAFKQELFRTILYGDPKQRYVYDSRLYALFGREFPTVLRFIDWLKRDQYQNLAREMQRRESAYIFGQVAERLRLNHPAVPFVTIHDNLLTVPEHLETVRQTMVREFERLGIRPALKVGAT